MHWCFHGNVTFLPTASGAMIRLHPDQHICKPPKKIPTWRFRSNKTCVYPHVYICICKYVIYVYIEIRLCQACITRCCLFMYLGPCKPAVQTFSLHFFEKKKVPPSDASSWAPWWGISEPGGILKIVTVQSSEGGGGLFNDLWLTLWQWSTLWLSCSLWVGKCDFFLHWVIWSHSIYDGLQLEVEEWTLGAS